MIRISLGSIEKDLGDGSVFLCDVFSISQEYLGSDSVGYFQSIKKFHVPEVSSLYM